MPCKSKSRFSFVFLDETKSFGGDPGSSSHIIIIVWWLLHSSILPVKRKSWEVLQIEWRSTHLCSCLPPRLDNPSRFFTQVDCNNSFNNSIREFHFSFSFRFTEGYYYAWNDVIRNEEKKRVTRCVLSYLALFLCLILWTEQKNLQSWNNGASRRCSVFTKA